MYYDFSVDKDADFGTLLKHYLFKLFDINDNEIGRAIVNVINVWKAEDKGLDFIILDSVRDYIEAIPDGLREGFKYRKFSHLCYLSHLSIKEEYRRKKYGSYFIESVEGSLYDECGVDMGSKLLIYGTIDPQEFDQNTLEDKQHMISFYAKNEYSIQKTSNDISKQVRFFKEY